MRKETIQATRGTIFDRNGIMLATNRPVISLYWVGTGKKQLQDSQKELLHSLEYILDMDIVGNESFIKHYVDTKEQRSG